MKRRHYRQIGRCQGNFLRRYDGRGYAARPARTMPASRLEVPSLIAGRFAVVGALFAFVMAYFYGIYQYGWWLGLAVGWLPSVIFTWLVAQVIARGIHYMVPYEASTLQSMSRIKFASVPFCCSGRANIVPRYRRQDK